ncbi:hypothetical protein DRQ36_07695 [bacterium]|nr:MAG: hypothetical protein DRQ36_07695 [bacterium]
MPAGRTRFTSELNERQIEGVLATEGPVLVLAGAGSGKTRLLTYKMAHLVLELGVDPATILGVTFTNKAAGEMRERAEKLCGESLRGIWLGTFHAVCGRILRAEAKKVGLTSNYSIYDESDQQRLMKDVIADISIDMQNETVKAILSRISNMKNRLITADGFAAAAASPKEKYLAKLWLAYQEALRANNAVDFDDMINLVVKILAENPKTKRKYSKRFEYILVDEFQDTNRAQFELVRHLASVNKNITVVGDDDQSIYGWRGAEIRNILEFPEHFAKAKIIRLEQNYRSTGNILSAASAVVANNASRHPKTLWTAGGPGEKVSLWEVPDAYIEAEDVAESIKESIDNGVIGSEIAILYRINAHSRLLEDALRKLSIPYIIVGGIRFYDRAEIKDILAYLKLINNRSDDVAFTRIVNMPRRGIGAKSLLALREIAKEKKLSLYGTLLEGDLSALPKRSQEGFGGFVDIMEELVKLAKDTDIGELIGEVVRRSGYLEKLEEDGSIEARARLDNISELVNSGIEFAKKHPEEPSLAAYLAETSLLTGIDEYGPDEETVSLMTVHSAKGLEFDIVYICGLEEGLFPIARSMESTQELEEERRLFYVAVTRARKKVHLFWSGRRQKFGEEYIGFRSRFIDEIPDNLIQKETRSNKRAGLVILHTGGNKRHRGEPAIAPGAIVEHPFFGRGEVRAVKGWGENATLTVAFPKYGTKRLLLKYADLAIVRD